MGSAGVLEAGLPLAAGGLLLAAGLLEAAPPPPPPQAARDRAIAEARSTDKSFFTFHSSILILSPAEAAASVQSDASIVKLWDEKVNMPKTTF